MMAKKKIEKLYCYVDESGQDTKGKWFLVVVIIIIEDKNNIEKTLLEIEYSSGRHATKWHKSKHRQRQEYCHQIAKISKNKINIYYSVYKNTILFLDSIALTTAKAITDKSPKNYQANIVIDGLGRNLEKRFASLLRRYEISTKKIKSARDESSPFIRLSDSMAGLLRDAFENKVWAKEIADRLISRKIIKEL